MISLDEQIELQEPCAGNPIEAAILLSLRRLKRIEELMREPSGEMNKTGAYVISGNAAALGADHGTAANIYKSMSATLLKQVEEEAK